MESALSSLPAAARVLAKPLDGHLNVMIHKSSSVEFILLKSNVCFDCQSTLCPGSPATSQLKMTGNSSLALSLPVSGDKKRKNSTEIHSLKKLPCGLLCPRTWLQVVPLGGARLGSSHHAHPPPSPSGNTSQIIQLRLRSLPPCCERDLQPKTHSPGWLL